MRDQAEELRNLVSRRTTSPRPFPIGPTPQLVVFSGGRAGAGVTCLALNVAVSLAEQGTRVVLLDADPRKADIARRCGLPPAAHLDDILSGRRSIHETIERGPAGLQVIPGTASSEAGSYGDSAYQHLVSQIRSLGKHADTVVVDAGSQTGELTSLLWQSCDLAIVVTAPDAAAIMDTYASIKANRDALFEPQIDVALIVNRVADPTAAGDVHRRIDLSCRRFLHQSIALLGHIPQENANRWSHGPFVLEHPESAAARAIDAVAAMIMRHGQKQNRVAA